MTQLACNPLIKIMIDDIQETRVLVDSLLKTKHYQRLGPEGVFAIIQKAKATNINPLDALNGGMYYYSEHKMDCRKIFGEMGVYTSKAGSSCH